VVVRLEFLVEEEESRGPFVALAIAFYAQLLGRLPGAIGPGGRKDSAGVGIPLVLDDAVVPFVVVEQGDGDSPEVLVI
jgi:hypothetical protein